MQKRNTSVDVRCTDSENKQFIVKIQLYWSRFFKSRIFFNDSKISLMSPYGTNDFTVPMPVYALNFVSDEPEESIGMEDEYFHHYKTVIIKETKKQIEGLEFFFVELHNFKPLNRSKNKLHELWMRFLTEIDGTTKEVPQELLENEIIHEAVGRVEWSAYTRDQIDAYYQRKIDIMTERGIISDAIEKGKADTGAEEKTKEKTQVVINSHRVGIPIPTIAAITNLSVEQITEILRRNGIVVSGET